MYDPKFISKESIQFFTSKSSLVNWTKIKIIAKEKNKSPTTLVEKPEKSSARKLF